MPPEKRQTIFRYDDTNPEAESSEYIQSLAEDVDWMGWKPDPVTFTSDYFQRLYELAVELIVRGKAYVCHQSKAEIEACREIAKAKAADPNAPGDPCSPYRNRPVAESLKEFDNMKNGKYGASDATLRMKMDMTSPNPNMWDQVAYRIKYVPHPHAGSEWCIYPTYDYTHCIIDSLVNHSIHLHKPIPRIPHTFYTRFAYSVSQFPFASLSSYRRTLTIPFARWSSRRDGKATSGY